MTRWWWVRHGPTHAKAFAGWRDIPADLSDGPHLARLAEFLPQDAVLVSSDLVRATATADAIQRARHRLPHERDLREFDFGQWDGRHFKEVSQSHPELSRLYWERPGDIAPPDGESWNDAAARIEPVIARLSQAHAGRDIVAVAHFGTILTQVQKARGISAYDALAQKIDNLSVTCCAFDGQAWTLELVNHLTA
ncbi:MAG: histidine phosphatase family protein [Pseudomonadota bacterium]